MRLETKFLPLKAPVTVGSRFGDWRVCWLVDGRGMGSPSELRYQRANRVKTNRNGQAGSSYYPQLATYKPKRRPRLLQRYLGSRRYQDLFDCFLIG